MADFYKFSVQELYSDFCYYFPNMQDRVLDYYKSGREELTIELRGRETAIFHGPTHGIRMIRSMMIPAMSSPRTDGMRSFAAAMPQKRAANKITPSCMARIDICAATERFSIINCLNLNADKTIYFLSGYLINIHPNCRFVNRKA